MFLAMRSEVEDALATALEHLDLPADDLGIEQPPDDVDAVLASSVAFRLAGEVGAPPPQVAADVAAEIDPDDYDYVGDVVTEGPYLNFLPSERYFADTLTAARGEDWGWLDSTGTTYVVEHTSANPTGPVHVGRARNPIIGDALSNLLERAGHDVERHYYVNDAGRQMAIFTWAYETFDESDLPQPERDKRDYDLVRYYRKGNEYLEDADEDAVEEAEREIASIIEGLDRGDEETYERVSAVVEGVLEGMAESLERLGVGFDEFVRETRFMGTGETDDVVERLKALDQAVYEDDAWQLDLSEFGVEKNFVFLRSDGTTLYTTRDIAHHEWKFDNYDRAITVIGEDHELTFRQLDHALDLLGNDTDRLEQVFYSWVSLPGGEGMSTRKGTGVDLDELLDEAIDRARQEVHDRMDDRVRSDDLTEDDVERIARQVGIGAVRFDVVAKQPSKAITFEWDRALDFEAQSAPYVQYVHARCCGILDESDDARRVEDGADGDGDVASALDAGPTYEVPDADASALEHPAARDLRVPDAEFQADRVAAAAEREPHRIATYSRTFADRFNAFYRECPVLSADDPDVRAARLALVAAARRTVAGALSTLGVAAPESM